MLGDKADKSLSVVQRARLAGLQRNAHVPQIRMVHVCHLQVLQLQKGILLYQGTQGSSSKELRYLCTSHQTIFFMDANKKICLKNFLWVQAVVSQGSMRMAWREEHGWVYQFVFLQDIFL